MSLGIILTMTTMVLDVHVRDCSTRWRWEQILYADNGKPIYAAADGIVDEVWKDK
jgi:hypothetical protein